jgi:superfamily II DNA or RNA helicase/HKD family nuclease
MDDRTNFIKGGDDGLLDHLRSEFSKSKSIDINVAFAFSAGVALMREDLESLISRNLDGSRLPVRILVGDYLDATEPNALRNLLKLGDGIDLRIFETKTTSCSFHPKSFVFHYEEGGGAAFVGSSNLSRSALVDGIEWNYRICSSIDKCSFEEVKKEFETLFDCDQVKRVDELWIKQYEARRVVKLVSNLSGPNEEPIQELLQESSLETFIPHVIQQEALEALSSSRQQHETAGLVVLATGLGKTWLSAFDSHQFDRILFVAHREEILNQARNTFEKICPGRTMGFCRGGEHELDVDILFASVQTLKNHLDSFAPDYFDYVIVDEFHHAAAKTYRSLIDYFTPQYLLGLTATPERMDGGDILALCDDNLVYRCDLIRGIEVNRLSPFHYFGVPDDIEYENIPWRSGKFDANELTNAWAVETRADNALEQLETKGGMRTLCFCCSVTHADYMKGYFNKRGKLAMVVHSGEDSDGRSEAIAKLKDGSIDIICAVDIFNEGVDIPNVDTVLMLRPTESPTIWAQQFGRGLRYVEGKTLKVIDYIGNHKSFLEKSKTLFMVNNERELKQKLEEHDAGILELPAGCEITYDLEAKNILDQLVTQKLAVTDQRELFYDEYKDSHGERPLLIHAYNADVLKKGSVWRSGWFNQIVAKKGDLFDGIYSDPMMLDFLEEVEKTNMTKLFKMVVLKGMLAYGIDQPVPVAFLRDFFRKEMLSNKSLVKELETYSKTDSLLEGCIRKNPIKAWLSRTNSKEEKYFKFESDALRLDFAIPGDCLEAFSDYVRELVDYRLIRQLDKYKATSNKLNDLRDLVLYEQYKTDEITSYFPTEDKAGNTVGGYWRLDEDNILPVTLSKPKDTEEHLRYADRFIDGSTFQWESPAGTKQKKPEGQSIIKENPNKFQLFVRESKTANGKTLPYFYCGEIELINYESECPIRCTFKLKHKLPAEIFERFKAAQPAIEDE